MAVTMFWVATSCTLEDIHWRFGGTWCFHLQGRKVIQARRKYKNLLLAWWFGLLLDPKDKSRTFLRAVDKLRLDYTAQHHATRWVAGVRFLAGRLITLFAKSKPSLRFSHSLIGNKAAVSWSSTSSNPHIFMELVWLKHILSVSLSLYGSTALWTLVAFSVS
jgi:hypothetical protein